MQNIVPIPPIRPAIVLRKGMAGGASQEIAMFSPPPPKKQPSLINVILLASVFALALATIGLVSTVKMLDQAGHYLEVENTSHHNARSE